MKILRKKSIRIAATIILSALFLYLAFRSLEWEKVLSAFQNYNYWWLLPVTFLVILSILLQTLRWKLLIKPVKDIKIGLLFEAIVLSHFANILLPINIGEIVKAYLLKRKTKIAMSSVFGSIAAERVLKILGFLIVGVFAILMVKLPKELDQFNSQVINGLKISTAIFLGMVTLILLAKKYRKLASGFVHKVASKISKKHKNSVLHIFENFLAGMSFGKNKKDAFMIIFYSIAIRVVFGIATLSIAKGFGVDISLITFLFIDIFVTFVHSLGTHLGGIIGAYEAALTYSLFAFGVAREIGLSIALIADVTFIAPSLILGIIYFLKEGLALKKLRTLKH